MPIFSVRGEYTPQLKGAKVSYIHAASEQDALEEFCDMHAEEIEQGRIVHVRVDAQKVKE